MVEGLKNFIAKYGIRKKGGKLILYKAVSEEWGSIWVRAQFKYPDLAKGGKDVYCPGKEVITRKCNVDRSLECGCGLHVGTIACALKFTHDYFLTHDNHNRRRIVRVLVDPEDVVCVPHGGLCFSPCPESQKIRCSRLVVECETNMDGRKKRRGNNGTKQAGTETSD